MGSRRRGVEEGGVEGWGLKKGEQNEEVEIRVVEGGRVGALAAKRCGVEAWVIEGTGVRAWGVDGLRLKGGRAKGGREKGVGLAGYNYMEGELKGREQEEGQ